MNVVQLTNTDNVKTNTYPVFVKTNFDWSVLSHSHNMTLYIPQILEKHQQDVMWI